MFVSDVECRRGVVVVRQVVINNQVNSTVRVLIGYGDECFGVTTEHHTADILNSLVYSNITRGNSKVCTIEGLATPLLVSVTSSTSDGDNVITDSGINTLTTSKG